MDEHTLNDLLECSVCLERLDTSSKVLPCQHTFCRKCLEVIVSSHHELRCPECRVLVEVKIDELPPNVLLMRILEGMKNVASAKNQHCEDSNQSKAIDDKVGNEQRLNDERQLQMKVKLQQQHKRLLQYQQQQQQQHLHHKTNLQQQSPPQVQHQPNVSSNVAAQQQQPQQPIQSNHQQPQQISTTQQQPQQIRRCLVPHAYALYDFVSNEPSDLNFKKGNLILLKRRIDMNWYVGQSNGVEGTFPINYVHVVVPLPSPQCVALYDFKMGPNEEEGCLTFKKGAVIHVLRRIDHNWAEGRIGTMIGIFPIAFVELNSLAKQLLDTFPPATTTKNTSHGSDANTQQPVTPLQVQQQQQQYSVQQLRNLPPIPQLDPTKNSHPGDSTSSSNTTSPDSATNTNTTSSNTNSSSSTPTSPNRSFPNTPQHRLESSGGSGGSVRFRENREKRHSLNALLSSGANMRISPTLSVLQSNRHSAEILSVPNELSVHQNGTGHSGDSESMNPTTTITTDGAATQQRTIALEQQFSTSTTSAAAAAFGSNPSTHSRINVLKTNVQQNGPPSLPWGYLALYPYKPRKSDELELKKGCVYIVTERCLDGWFKGKNWQDISGVFPGNYVTPLRSRDQQQLIHQWKYIPSSQNTSSTTATVSQAAATTTNVLINSKNQENSNSRSVLSHQPPDLPPRQMNTTGINENATNALTSVWMKPLGHTVEAFFNRSNNNKVAGPGQEQNSIEKNTNNVKEGVKNAPLTSFSSASPSTFSSTSPPSSTTCASTSAAVSLMKRLAHIKTRSKSPNDAVTKSTQISHHTPQQSQNSNCNHPMENLTFENTQTQGNAQKNTTTHAPINPLHVRSGSCPSQLLQSLPIDSTMLQAPSQMSSENANAMNHQQQQHQQQQSKLMQQKQILSAGNYGAGGGSQRLKGIKERPQIIRQSMDGTIRSVFNNSNSQQQQQQLSAKNFPKCAQQQQQQQQQQHQQVQNQFYHQSNAINHRKSQSLDANAFITPNTSATTATTAHTTTSAASSAVTTLTSGNITAAAIAASATTKSMQGTRESRFRCIVPYPPNSDVELELHVGDIIFVQRKQKNGWYKGTHARTNKTGLFPASFVEPDI